MIDSNAIASKRRSNVAFEPSNACANAHEHANAFDGVIEHSDVDAMSAETFATMASNSVDAVRQPRPQRSSAPADPNPCDSVSG